MSKVNLNDVTTFQNDTTAANIVNTNSATIETAFDNTLSRDGTSPNQMGANLDMNSFRILNLPAPIAGQEPLRLTDASVLNGGGTITTGLTSVGLVMPADYTVTGSPLTSNGNITVAFATPPTGTGAHVRATSPTIATPTISSPTISSPTMTSPSFSTIVNTGTLTLPTSTDTLVGRATTDTFTNKTFNTGGAGNVLQINGVGVSRGQYVGTNTNDTATAGNIGQLMTNSQPVAQALTNGTALTICSLTLTAGDWEVSGALQFTGGVTTNIAYIAGSISTTTNTLTLTPLVGCLVAPGGSGSTLFTSSLTPILVTPVVDFSVASTQTVFLVAQSGFSVSTCSVSGYLRARRPR